MMGLVLHSRHRPITRFSGTQMCTPSNVAGWLRGARVLIRPHEVAHLFDMVRVNWGCLPLGDAVSVAMKVLLGDRWVRYERDPRDCDAWRSPALTLQLGYGDCEDLAGVVGSLIALTGREPNLMIGHWNGGGHAWIESADERGPFLLEGTTGEIHRHYRPAGYIAMTAVNRFGARRA